MKIYLFIYLKHVCSHPSFSQIWAAFSQRLKNIWNHFKNYKKNTIRWNIFKKNQNLVPIHGNVPSSNLPKLGKRSRSLKALWKVKKMSACWTSGGKMFHRARTAMKKAHFQAPVKWQYLGKQPGMCTPYDVVGQVNLLKERQSCS